jgi:single-strand DNA-binding protein
MKGMNRVTLIGLVGDDPDIRVTEGGRDVVNFSMATSELWRDKESGERKEATEWHQCCAFGMIAKIISENVKKGDRLCIEGKLRTNTYEKEGQKHYSTKVMAHEIIFLSPKGNDNRQGQPDQRPSAPGDYTPRKGYEDDEIPFN